MSRWWRAYDEALHDPKLVALSDKHHRAWFNLLCVASKNEGVLPPMSTVALELRTSLHKAAECVTILVQAGLIDEIEAGKFAPHNWGRRQFQSDSSTERVKRFRKRERNVSETPPETETYTEAETEKKRTRASARWPFDEFWRQYPNKVGKAAALTAFRKVEKSGKTSLESLMLGLMRYAAKTDDRPWCNPATWLNQARWEDQPAAKISQNGGLFHEQSPGDRARQLAEIAREREFEAGFVRPSDALGGARGGRPDD